MPHMTDRSCVAAQYADDRNLSIRMKLHAKHSTAQISMNDWLFARKLVCFPFPKTGCRACS